MPFGGEAMFAQSRGGRVLWLAVIQQEQ